MRPGLAEFYILLPLRSYWCRECREQQEEKEVAWRYYLGLSVSDHSASTDVVAFGEQLDAIFGAPASHLHQ